MGLESKRGKQAMYHLYSFQNAQAIAGKDVSDFSKNDEIRDMTDEELSQHEIQLKESFFLHFYLKTFDKEYTRGMLLDEFILVDLSADYETMKKQCNDGIWFRGERFVYFTTSPNWLKFESAKSKGKALFIKHSKIKAKELFEAAVSLNKIKNYDGKEKKISKEMARISLGFTSAYKTDIKPKMIILPECTYKIVSDVEVVKLKKAEVDEGVVTWIQKENEVQVLKDYEVNVTQFDGCGVMSKELAKQIQSEMNVEHEVTWAGIRLYGLAIKGLVCSMDYKEYMHQHYTHDTDFIKKDNRKIYIKDYTNEWQCVDDSDMLINESQAKWAGNFESYDEYESILGNLNKYGDLYTLYIAKINKANADVKENTTNYQLIGNLALTPNKLQELQKLTENAYRKIINKDVDTTSIFLNTFVTRDEEEEETEESEDDIECTDEEETLESKELNISTKVGELLLLSPEFIESNYVQNQIRKMLRKKIKHLMGGKFYIKNSYYQTAIQDPISYLDWIVGRTDKNSFIDSTNGLKAHQFYNTDINDGEVRTISRNPLNSYSEILNVSFAETEYLNKWLGHLTKDMIVFNCFDLTKECLSGCDFDLDTIFVVDSPIVRDAVIPALPFINIEDVTKEDKKLEWSTNNILYAVHHSSGNFIGRLANKGASVANRSAAYRQEYMTEDGQGTKEEYYNYFKKEKNPEKTGEVLVVNGKEAKKVNGINKKVFIGTFDHFQVGWYRRIKSGEITKIVKSEEEIKAEIINNFIGNRIYSYRLRDLQMKAIDIPKTLQKLDESEYKDIFKEFKTNAAYLQHFKSHRIRKPEYATNAINLNAERISTDESMHFNPKDSAKTILEYLTFTIDTESDEYINCVNEVKFLFEKYKTYGADINKKYKELINNSQDIEKTIHENSKKAEIDSKNKILLKDAEKIISKYDLLTLSTALVSNISSEIFIFNYFFDVAKEAIKVQLTIGTKVNIYRYQYIQDPEGEIEFLLDRYRKVKCEDIPEVKNDLQAEYKRQCIQRANRKIMGEYTLVGIDEDIKQDIVDYEGKKCTAKLYDYQGTMKGYLIDVENGNKLGMIKDKEVSAYVLEDKEIKYSIVKMNNKSCVINVVDFD